MPTGLHRQPVLGGPAHRRGQFLDGGGGDLPCGPGGDVARPVTPRAALVRRSLCCSSVPPLPTAAPACCSRRYPRNATAAASGPGHRRHPVPRPRPGGVDHPAGGGGAERHADREPGADPGHALGQLARVVRAASTRAIVVIIVGAMDRPATKSATARNGKFPTSRRGIILTAIAQTPSSHRRAGGALEVQQPEDRSRPGRSPPRRRPAPGSPRPCGPAPRRRPP